MKQCLHDFETNEDYSDFCHKGCGETFQNYNTKLRDERIAKLESDLARVTELLKSACDRLRELEEETRDHHAKTISTHNFLNGPKIKEILK